MEQAERAQRKQVETRDDSWLSLPAPSSRRVEQHSLAELLLPEFESGKVPGPESPKIVPSSVPTNDLNQAHESAAHQRRNEFAGCKKIIEIGNSTA